MAQTISIGATQYIDLLKDRLGQKLNFLEGNGLKVILEERPAGRLTFLSCRLTGYGSYVYTREEDCWTAFRQFLADIISDLILNHWEDQLLKDIIRENYFYFDNQERKIIYNYALHHVYSDDEESCLNPIYRSDRKNRILQKVMDFLHYNNSVVIDGFIRFRLKEYLGELREAADKAVDDYLMEREYQEFIQLLKYFVDVQEPRAEVVNILVNGAGNFKLYDEKMEPIKNDYMEGFVVELVDNEINFEDLLISALITIAPKNIVLHYKDDSVKSATIDTIEGVFAGRVLECAGCGFCREN